MSFAAAAVVEIVASEGPWRQRDQRPAGVRQVEAGAGFFEMLGAVCTIAHLPVARPPCVDLDTRMSPILRKLSGRRVPLTEMADILEKYTGYGADERHCREACDALRRVRKERRNFYIQAALQVLDRDADPCTCVRKIIQALRKWRYVSGA